VTRKFATDAMFKLEHGVGDKEKAKDIEAALEALTDFQASRWQDDYSANRALRQAMRTKRTTEKEQATKDASYNLSVPLFTPNENDIKTAKLLQFTQTKSSDQLLKEKRECIDAQSVFAKLKTKPVSPLVKKAYARQSIEGLITSSQKNFSSTRNNMKPHNLGIVPKKMEAKLKTSSLSENCTESLRDANLNNEYGESSSTSAAYSVSNDSLVSVLGDGKKFEAISGGSSKSEDKQLCCDRSQGLSLVGYDISSSESD
ncbi:hypothetical protein SK128_012140, partial [Halocaridina rubra]